jgi:hypothetical protein
VIYAIPSDGTDRSLDTDGTIVSSVNAWNSWLASQTGGLGGLRLDTSGGSLDITFFKDPHTDAQIAARGAFVRDQLESDLHAAGFDSPGKVYVVYYDGTSTYACGGGAWPPTLPGDVAAMYLHGLPSSPVPCDTNQFAPNGQPGYLDYSMLHEIMHTLGFVASCAPHFFAAGHVSDSPTDLMYAGAQPWSPSVLDYGHDDYFDTGNASCPDLARSPYLVGNAPAQSALVLSRPRVAAGKISFRLNAAATVTLRFDQRVRNRYLRRRTLTIRASQGATFVPFAKRGGSRPLPSGTYRVSLVAEAGTQTSRVQTVRLSVR